MTCPKTSFFFEVRTLDSPLEDIFCLDSHVFFIETINNDMFFGGEKQINKKKTPKAMFFVFLFFTIALANIEPKSLVQLMPDTWEYREHSLTVAMHIGFLSGLNEVCAFQTLSFEQDVFGLGRGHMFTCQGIQIRFQAEKVSWLYGNASTFEEKLEYLNKTKSNVLAIVVPTANPSLLERENECTSEEKEAHTIRERAFPQDTTYSSLDSFPIGIFSPVFPLPFTHLRTPLHSSFSPKMIHIRTTVADDAAASINVISHYCSTCGIGILFEISPPSLQARQILRSVLLSHGTKLINAEEGLRFANESVSEIKSIVPNPKLSLWSSDGLILLFSRPQRLAIALNRYITNLRLTPVKWEFITLSVMSSVMQNMQDIVTHEQIREVLSFPEFTTCWETHKCHKIFFVVSDLTPNPRDISHPLTHSFHRATSSLLTKIAESYPPKLAKQANQKLIKMLSRHLSVAMEGYMTARAICMSIQGLVENHQEVNAKGTVEQFFRYGMMLLDEFRLGPFGDHCEQIGSGCECNQGMRSVRHSHIKVEQVVNNTKSIYPLLVTANNATHRLMSKPLHELSLHFAECGFPLALRQNQMIVGHICSLESDAALCKRIQIGILAALAIVNAEGGVHGSYMRLKAANDGRDPKLAGEIADKWVTEHSEIQYSTYRSQIIAFLGITNESTMGAISAVTTNKRIPILGPRVGMESARHPVNPFHIFIRPTLLEEKEQLVDYFTNHKMIFRIACVASNDDFGTENVEHLVRVLTKHNAPLYALNYVNTQALLLEQVDSVVKALQESQNLYEKGPAQVVFIDLLSVNSISAIMEAIWRQWPSTYFALSSLIEPMDLVSFLKIKFSPKDLDALLNMTFMSQFLPAFGSMDIPQSSPKVDNTIPKKDDLIDEHKSALLLLRSQFRLQQYMSDHGEEHVPEDISTLVDFPTLTNLNLSDQDFAPTFTSLEAYVAGRLLVDAIKRDASDHFVENLIDTVYLMRILSIGGSNGVVLGPYEYPPRNNIEECMKKVFDNFNKQEQNYKIGENIDLYCGCNRGADTLSLYTLSNEGDLKALSNSKDTKILYR